MQNEENMYFLQSKGANQMKGKNVPPAELHEMYLLQCEGDLSLLQSAAKLFLCSSAECGGFVPPAE
jgi:hypothetical protein